MTKALLSYAILTATMFSCAENNAVSRVSTESPSQDESSVEPNANDGSDLGLTTLNPAVPKLTLLFGVSPPFTYRQTPSGGFDMYFILQSTITGSTNICFTFDSEGPESCSGHRNVNFKPGPWGSVTNVSCHSPDLGATSCLKLNVWKVDFNTDTYTRLTPVAGIPVLRSSTGLNSSFAKKPEITQVRYETSSASGDPYSIDAVGRVRVYASNLVANKQYALLVDGIPYNNYVANAGASRAFPNQGFLDFTGYALPEGSFQFQLAEYAEPSTTVDAKDVLASSLKPFATGTLTAAAFRIQGYTPTCFGVDGQGNPECSIIRGISNPAVALTLCSTPSVCRTPANYSDQLVASINFFTSKTGFEIDTTTQQCPTAGLPLCHVYLKQGPRTAYTNPGNRFDVNNDGFVTPLDVLTVINRINNRTLTLTLTNPGVAPFYDVSGDGFLSALDALRVINEINRVSRSN